MSARMDSEYLEKQAQRRMQLVEEGVSGVTVRDTLPNTAYPLQEEAEAMYFKNARNFLKTSLAHRIIDSKQDIIMKG